METVFSVIILVVYIVSEPFLGVSNENGEPSAKERRA